MKRFDSLSDLEKYGLLLEFVSQTTPNDNLKIVFYPKSSRIYIDHPFYDFEHEKLNFDYFSRESALKYVSKTIIDDFGTSHKYSQLKFVRYFFNHHTLKINMNFCYGCQKVSFRWDYKNIQIGCIVMGCGVEYCKACYKKFPVERRRTYKSYYEQGTSMYFRNTKCVMCHIHDSLFGLLLHQKTTKSYYAY
jgi:hypothetical protein